MNSMSSSAEGNISRSVDYSGSASPQQKVESKDSDYDSSAGSEAVSMFANILQSRIDVQEKTGTNTGDGQDRKTDLSGTTAEGDVQNGNGPAAAVQSDQKTSSGDQTTDQAKSGTSGNDLKAAPKATETVSQDVQGVAVGAEAYGDGNTAEENTFMKNLASLLKQDGASDRNVDQMLSQVKSASLVKKDSLPKDDSVNESANILKGFESADKNTQKISGAQKSGAHSSDKGADSQERAMDAVQQEDVAPDTRNLKTAVTRGDTATDFMQDVKMEDAESIGHDGSKTSAKDSSGTVGDQKQNTVIGNTASTAKTETTANLRPQYLIEQIVNSRELLTKGEGRVKLTLNPPSLGTMDMDVRVRSNRVEVTVMADNKEVRQILQTNLDDLKNALREHGMQIDRFNIQWQDGGQGKPFWEYAEGSLAWENEGSEGSDARQTLADDYPIQNRIRAEEGAGVISVFA